MRAANAPPIFALQLLLSGLKSTCILANWWLKTFTAETRSTAAERTQRKTSTLSVRPPR
jgi:hypothetical protein